MKTKRLFFLVITLALIATGSVQAETRNYLRELYNLYDNGQLGGDKDTWPLAANLKESLPSISESILEDYARSEALVKAAVLPQLNTILNSLESAINNPENYGKYGSTEALRPLKKPLLIAFDNISAGVKEGGPESPSFWQFDFDSGFNGRIPTDIYSSLMDLSEADPAGEDCIRAFDSTKQLLRYTRVIERLLTYYKRLKLIKIKEAVTELYKKQWEHYFNDTRPQYIWELQLNSRFYHRTRKNKRALQQPPDHQWILLHPGGALEYIEEAPEGDAFKESIILELVGYNKWRWQPDGEMKRSLGFSLITGYSDRPGMNDVGYGVMLHYKHRFSFGITQRSGNTGYFMSFELGNHLTKASEELKRAFKLSR